MFGDIAANRVEFISRQTNPGSKTEEIIEYTLRVHGYSVQAQVNVGMRPEGTKHRVDFVATRADRKLLISSKWQASSGTGEDKHAYEAMSLAHAMKQDPSVTMAYVVISGDGWTPKKRAWWLAGLHRDWIRGSDRVQFVGMDTFMSLVARGAL